MTSERNRASELLNKGAGTTSLSAETQETLALYQKACDTGLDPDRVADHVFDAIRNEKFYIFTHPEYIALMEERFDAILQKSNPRDIAVINKMLKDILDVSAQK